MLLILKARELSPKQGYFYRSWVAIFNLIVMAKDLGLHEHLRSHQSGTACGSSIPICVMKTRVWQQLFLLETTVGGSQGTYSKTMSAVQH